MANALVAFVKIGQERTVILVKLIDNVLVGEILGVPIQEIALRVAGALWRNSPIWQANGRVGREEWTIRTEEGEGYVTFD